jgi:predicted 3-demethylubiquinone-9 3-methyltransferase (glyoxalase superfamily)
VAAPAGPVTGKHSKILLPRCRGGVLGSDVPVSPPSSRDPPGVRHMQKITPFLWFDDNAEEAVELYVSTFKNSKISSVSRNGGPTGPIMQVTFELEGQRFMALNGGPHFTFSPAISLFVSCETQAEVDELWNKLSEDGEPQECGWLRDKFGVSWQIIPTALGRLLGDPDPAKAKRVMEAMLAMTKLDIAGLERAHQGK